MQETILAISRNVCVRIDFVLHFDLEIMVEKDWWRIIVSREQISRSK